MADEQEVPFVAGPPPVLETERRNPWTWFILGGIFLILIGSSLFRYFTPEHDAAASSEADTVTFRVQMAMSAFEEEAGAGGDATTKAELEKAMSQNKKAFAERNREAADKLEKAPTLSTTEARLLLGLKRELGDEPDGRALHLLATSKNETNRNVADIYSADTLTKPEADRLAPKGKDFLDRLAAVHAHEKAGEKGQRKTLVNFGAAAGLFVLALAAMGAILIGGMVWIFHLSARANGAAPHGLPMPMMSKGVADRFALRMSLYLIGFITISILMQRLPKMDGILSGVLGLAAVAVFVIGMLHIPLFNVADSFKKVAGKRPARGIFGPALAGWMANGPLMVGMILVSTFLLRFLPAPSHPVTQEIASTTDPLRLGLIFMTASVFAPIIEETTFRGLLFPALTVLSGKPWVGMVASGLLFAAIHPQGPALWPALAGLGVLMAYLTYWTGSIVPGMVLHALHNATILTLGILINML